MSFPHPRTVLLAFGIAAVAAGAQAADGKAVYDKTCAACHATGVANAPKLGDKAAWAPRVAAGPAALVASATQGKGAMPPKGGADLKPDELKAAVDYLLAAVK